MKRERFAAVLSVDGEIVIGVFVAPGELAERLKVPEIEGKRDRYGAVLRDDGVVVVGIAMPPAALKAYKSAAKPKIQR